MNTRMSRRVLAFGAAFAATTALTTTSALASTPAATTTCPWTASNGTNLGTVICGYGTSLVYFPNGTAEGFAVGTSHAVWTAWNNTSGKWSEESMGGSAYSAVTVKSSDGWSVEITYQDASDTTHCDFRGSTQSSGWSGWSTGDC